MPARSSGRAPTNRYLCVAVLSFFDGIVFAIAEAENPIDVAIPKALDSAIVSNPDAPGPYQVLGDWLQTHCRSAWGELIAVQHAREAVPDDRGLRERERDLISLLEPSWVGEPDPRGRLTVAREWRWGAVRAAELVGAHHQRLADELQDLLTSPRGRYLRGLVLSTRFHSGFLAGALSLLVSERPRVLASLSLHARLLRPRAQDDLRGVWAERPIDLGGLWDALPALRELSLAGHFLLGRVPPGRLQALTIEFSEGFREMRALENVPLDGLEQLSVKISSSANLARLKSWITPARMPALRDLAISVPKRALGRNVRRWPIAGQLGRLLVSIHSM